MSANAPLPALAQARARSCARVCTRHDTQSAQRILHRFRILPLDPSGVCVCGCEREREKERERSCSINLCCVCVPIRHGRATPVVLTTSPGHLLGHPLSGHGTLETVSSWGQFVSENKTSIGAQAVGGLGAACAPLGRQMLALTVPVQHRRGEGDFSRNFSSFSLSLSLLSETPSLSSLFCFYSHSLRYDLAALNSDWRSDAAYGSTESGKTACLVRANRFLHT